VLQSKVAIAATNSFVGANDPGGPFSTLLPRVASTFRPWPGRTLILQLIRNCNWNLQRDAPAWARGRNAGNPPFDSGPPD
jgi:hypothetical protein